MSQVSAVSYFTFFLFFFHLAKEHHGGEKCAAEESKTPFSGSTPLLLSDPREALLCPRLCEWGRGTCLTLNT